MATYEVLYWHDIPLQVRARDENQRVSKPLPERFQLAIDKAAMEVGLIGDDAYSNVFRWHGPKERDGSAGEVAEAVVAELINNHPTIDWRKTAMELSKTMEGYE